MQLKLYRCIMQLAKMRFNPNFVELTAGVVTINYKQANKQGTVALIVLTICKRRKT